MQMPYMAVHDLASAQDHTSQSCSMRSGPAGLVLLQLAIPRLRTIQGLAAFNKAYRCTPGLACVCAHCILALCYKLLSFPALPAPVGR